MIDSVALMWVRWNYILSAEIKEVIQKVCYLPQINETPTLTVVVAEILDSATRIASECEKELISETYGFATAKIALKYKLLHQSSKYDNLFVNLGAFHNERVFFSTMEKYIAASRDHKVYSREKLQSLQKS